MQLEFQNITPDYAAKLLAEHNPNNRPMSRQHVLFISQEMQRGTFRPDNGDSIRFDASGNIIDGQHRLAAIVHAGKPVMMLVARGIEADAFATIDIGKPRTVNDIIGIDLKLDGVQMPRGTAASARLLLEYESRFSSGTSSDRSNRQAMSPVDMVRATCKRPGFIDAVERAAKIARKMLIVNTAPVAVTIIACENNNKAASDVYLHRLQTMEGLQPGAPEHSVDRALRTWKVNGSSLQRSAYGQLFALIRGYLASRDGERLNRIYVPATPETFPYLPTK